jgi:hypothetical protein
MVLCKVFFAPKRTLRVHVSNVGVKRITEEVVGFLPLNCSHSRVLSLLLFELGARKK